MPAATADTHEVGGSCHVPAMTGYTRSARLHYLTN